MEYESYKAGDIIFIENEKSNKKMYVIIHGTISVVTKKNVNIF